MKWSSVSTVARWEYHRFAKPRDLILGAVFFAVMFGAFGFVGHYIQSKSEEEKTVMVLGAAAMQLQAVESFERFQLQHAEGATPDLAAAESALREKEVDAVLVVSGIERAELIVREERGWQQEFMALVGQHRQAQRLAESGLDPQILQSLSAPVDIGRRTLGSQPGESSGAEPKTVLIVVGTMLMGLFLGFSYVFVAITGEKTQKVTESVLSAITPQDWIDGKILGLTIVVLVNLGSYALGYLLYKVAAVFIWHDPFQLPEGIGDPVSVIYLVLFSMLGFAFWFTLFGIVAATINDPNSSSRSSLIMLPFLPLAVAFMGIDQPDAAWMRLLSLTPGLSPAAMPVRIMRGHPHWAEILLSLALLVAMAVLFRRAAGRVFGVSMMMTGKEPSWREVWRWVRVP